MVKYAQSGNGLRRFCEFCKRPGVEGRELLTYWEKSRNRVICISCVPHILAASFEALRHAEKWRDQEWEENLILRSKLARFERFKGIEDDHVYPTKTYFSLGTNGNEHT